MLTVHHLNNSRSQRVLWLLEELGIPYEIKRYERDAKTLLAPPELRAVHPLGKSPVITDTGTTVAESGAIIEFVLARYGNGRLAPPPGTPERLRFTYWLHYAEGSLMPLMVMALVFNRMPASPMPFFARPIARGISNGVKKAFLGPQIKLHLDYLEAELGKSEWLAGPDFSAADIQMSFPVEAAASRSGASRSHPRLAEWLNRIRARPAWQRAQEKGGPFEILG